MATALARRRVSYAQSPTYQSAIARLRAAGVGVRRAGSAAKGRARAGSGADLKTSGLVIAGGAASGAVAGYMPQIAGIDSRLILGGVAVAAGIWGLKGKTGSALVLAGAGMLAAAASDYTANAIAPSESE